MELDGTFARLGAYVRMLEPRLGDVRLIAVDGPSGAGKTRFALRLAKQIDAPVVHTDDLLEGWDDQFTFWERLENRVLTPLRRGETAFYQRYRWDRGAFDPVPVRLDPAPVVIVEGVSAGRRAIFDSLSLLVFVDAPATLRLERALSRDGDDSVAFRAYLERWRAAEDRHFAVDRTAERADLVIDGAAEVGDDRYERLFRPRPD
jgi:uridine kinase